MANLEQLDAKVTATAPVEKCFDPFAAYRGGVQMDKLTDQKMADDDKKLDKLVPSLEIDGMHSKCGGDKKPHDGGLKKPEADNKLHATPGDHK